MMQSFWVMLDFHLQVKHNNILDLCSTSETVSDCRSQPSGPSRVRRYLALKSTPSSPAFLPLPLPKERKSTEIRLNCFISGCYACACMTSQPPGQTAFQEFAFFHHNVLSPCAELAHQTGRQRHL